MKTFGVVGWKNTGKTGLMERLVRNLAQRGLSVSAVKHAHHGFDLDRPGADSFRIRSSGARETLVSSARRWALTHELGGRDEMSLDDLLEKLSPVDLVLVEGFKRASHPKIETHRLEAGASLIAESDKSVVAVASDSPESLPPLEARKFDLGDTGAIARFVLGQTGLGPR